MHLRLARVKLSQDNTDSSGMMSFIKTILAHSKPPKIRPRLIETRESTRKRNSKVQSSRCRKKARCCFGIPHRSASCVSIRCVDHMLPGADDGAITLILYSLVGRRGRFSELFLGVEWKSPSDVGRVGKLIQKTPSQECFRWPSSSFSPFGGREATAA